MIVFELLLYEYACCGQIEMVNDPLVNKLFITSFILTSIVKRDSKSNNVRFPCFTEAIFASACKHNSIHPVIYCEKNKYVISKFYFKLTLLSV